MGGFNVNLILRMVWPNMAGVAGFRHAGLFQAELVTQVAFLALAD